MGGGGDVTEAGPHLHIAGTSELSLLARLLRPEVVARCCRDSLPGGGGERGEGGHLLRILVGEHEHLLEGRLAQWLHGQHLHPAQHLISPKPWSTPGDPAIGQS